ncbi:hypothetical protein ABB02_00238 [Clostridiaceae bacterium JG1575]|nr:hypothetical protein ABB02_00238 [Clostridiaceae bacterium JG1575]
MTSTQKQQIEIFRGKGESYAAIAETLGISKNTVKSYCRRHNNNSPFAADPMQSTNGVCVNCGEPLIQTTGSKKKRFCSDKCRLDWWAAHPEAGNRKAVYHFVCPVCGTTFTAYGNAQRKYCSRACASSARRACHE